MKKTKNSLLILLLLLFSFYQSQGQELLKFTFTATESKVIPGRNTTEKYTDGKIYDEDRIGNLALVSMSYENGCYTDGRFNHNDFKVELGNMKDNANKYSLPAFQLYEPSSKATQFLASRHWVYLKFPTKEDYTFYSFENGKINKFIELKAEEVNPDQFVPIKNLDASEIKGSKIFFYAPSKQSVSPFTPFSPTVEGAMVSKNALCEVWKYKYLVDANPIQAELNLDYYNRVPKYFLGKEDEGKVNLLWQSATDSKIYFSTFGEDFKSISTVNVFNEGNGLLLNGLKAEKKLFYLINQGQTKEGVSDILTLYKADLGGKILSKSVQNTTEKEGLNYYRQDHYMASMKYNNGKIFVMLGRIMQESPDGLHHQGGIAVLYNASDLKLYKYYGQTSSHSFANLAMNSQNGDFFGLDMGDNYPRGLHLLKFNSEKCTATKVLYTYKTAHATDSRGSFPVYPEISTDTKKFYKWSNDNATYSDLGGMVETENGIIVLFAGEPDPTGKSLNNARIGDQGSLDPRNIGFLKVRPDFENSTSEGCQVKEDLFLSKGLTENSGFFDYGGGWNPQSNAGVVWLTQYKDKSKETAQKIKTAKLPDGNLLVLWEKYAGDDYISTLAMKIDLNGKILVPALELGNQVRLGRSDEILVMGNKIIIANGNSVEQKLELVVLKF